jgi:hypothetical protein
LQVFPFLLLSFDTSGRWFGNFVWEFDLDHHYSCSWNYEKRIQCHG